MEPRTVQGGRAGRWNLRGAGRRVAAVVGAGLAVAGVVMTGAPPASAARPPLVWGAYTRPTGTQSERQAVEALERRIGRKLRIVRVFDLWDDPFPSSYDTWLKTSGHVPIYSVKAKTHGGH